MGDQSASIEKVNESLGKLSLDSKVKELKESGNEAFNKGNFKECLEFYLQAIHTPGVPQKKLALLYSNCSAAFLKLGNIQCAEENAKKAIDLSPTWSKGYYRLAMAYKANKNYKLAHENLLLCQQFHDNPKKLDCEIHSVENLVATKDLETNYVPLKVTNALFGSEILIRKIDKSAAAKYRKSITLAHRRDLNIEQFRRLMINIFLDSGINIQSKSKISLVGLKPICLTRMSKNRIHEGFALRLTVMEDPIGKDAGSPSINCIVRDEQNSYERLAIYNYNPNKTELQENLGFGSKISIANPYYKIAFDSIPLLRVDDFNTITVHSDLKNKKICRFCGEGDYKGQPVQCKTCTRCYYCTEECMKLDASELKHHLICKIQI